MKDTKAVKEQRVGSNTPQDIRIMKEGFKNGKTIIGRIWPPLEGLAEVDDMYETFKREKESVERTEIIEVFKELENKGYGRYVVGRRGWSTRFLWNEHARGMAEEQGYSEQEEPKAESIEHKFILRPEFEVSLTLPGDLNSKEAERLSSFVKTLPFGNERG